jgi:hypothetical protein
MHTLDFNTVIITVKLVIMYSDVTEIILNHIAAEVDTGRLHTQVKVSHYSHLRVYSVPTNPQIQKLKYFGSVCKKGHK